VPGLLLWMTRYHDASHYRRLFRLAARTARAGRAHRCADLSRADARRAPVALLATPAGYQLAEAGYWTLRFDYPGSFSQEFGRSGEKLAACPGAGMHVVPGMDHSMAGASGRRLAQAHMLELIAAGSAPQSVDHGRFGELGRTGTLPTSVLERLIGELVALRVPVEAQATWPAESLSDGRSARTQ
jgi:hypothetical protein